MKERLIKLQLIDGILQGNRGILGKAITVIESTLPGDTDLSNDLVSEIMPESGKSIRLGLTGVPGVGKSTFINRFGKIILEHGHKLAVLAIDPSSSNTRGSILGDKTRMNELLNYDNVFVRPTPTGETLGGVSRKTRETILLCEAAGYDFVIVETVGVGQSEITVKNMVDFLTLLIPPVGGDEVQGIKKGIMEQADCIVITKADGDMTTAADKAMMDYSSAIRILSASNLTHKIPVMTCSSLKNIGLEEIYLFMLERINARKREGLFTETRDKQYVQWMHHEIMNLIHDSIYKDPKKLKMIDTLEKRVLKKEISPQSAAKQLLNS